MLSIVAYYLLTSTCIGLQDSFYITAVITVIPKVEWKPQDLSNNRQLWYKGKPRDDGRFAIYDHDRKMYLEKNDAQFTLSPISDGKEPSSLWKREEKIVQQEQLGPNVISIVVSGVGAYLQHEIILYVVGLPLAFPDWKKFYSNAAA